MTKLFELEMKKQQYIKMMEKFNEQINDIDKLIKQLKEDIVND